MARFQGIGMGVAHFFPGWCSASSVLLFCFFFFIIMSSHFLG